MLGTVEDAWSLGCVDHPRTANVLPEFFAPWRSAMPGPFHDMSLCETSTTNAASDKSETRAGAWGREKLDAANTKRERDPLRRRRFRGD
jgi:hypothetical protein